MRLVIAGSGRLAYFLGRALLDHRHDVVFVARDRADCEGLARRLGAEAVVGDPTAPQALDDAGAGSADQVLAVTPRDDENLVVCQIAKLRFRVPRTLALANDPANEAVFRALGVDVAFAPTQILASLIEQRAGIDAVVGLVPAAGGRVRISEVAVAAGAAAVGCALRDLRLPPGALVGCVLRGDEAFVPNGDTVLARGDRAVLIAVAPIHDRAVQALTRAVR